MANVFDYLKWRDDIPLETLNEVDVLIFNRLVYFPWEKIVNSNESITMCNAYQKCLTINNLKYAKQDFELLKALAISNRYKNLVVSNVVSKVDIKKETEFMAMTIHLPKNYLYIVFRGTSNELMGWKESLNMSYKNIHSQIDALNYLNKTSLTKKIYIGGHSKGGHLAMHAAINTNRFIQNRIEKVFNYDGPGFLELSENYYKMSKKIISYLPSSSIVGRLLNMNHQIVIVDTDKKGFISHNLYTWKVEKDHFIFTEFNKESNLLKKVIDKFTLKVSKANREKLINDIFDNIYKTGATNIKEINFSKLKDILLSYRNLDDESKDMLFTIIKLLYESTKENIKLQKEKQ